MGMVMGLGVVISTVIYHYKEDIWYLDSIVGILIALLLFASGIRYHTRAEKETDRHDMTFYRQTD
jgi:divalent metal cation (Fe/Co/Zn/Cd) transporter